MAIVDLHLHSNKSDGEYAPSRVVRLAAEAGLRVMALTDHDTTDGIDEAFSEAAAVNAECACDKTRLSKPFLCLPGIEITTAHAHEQHILGYFIDHKAKPFRDFTERLMTLRGERTDNILEYLNRKGVRINYGEVKKFSNSSYIGRPQIAGAMARMGKVASIKDAFLKYLTGDEFRKVPKPKPTAEESIAQIRAVGGVAVLAHPDSLRLNDADLEASLKILKGQGLRGLECHYGIYDRERTRAYARLAEKLGLIVTGGSDFHGPRVKPGVLIATGKDGMLNFNDTDVTKRLKAATSRPRG
ncbi:MAG: PHP domain-containing protein [Clostridiales Family XIII bacterium]|jgi:predicted metal-dependent phosphoesterase TrpH|nr:PHP domain-containing protein [Clostridiales Family XIII bacterium]